MTVRPTRCRKWVENSKPLLLIGSLIDSGGGDKEQARPVLHLAFIFELYETQLHGGRYFLHAHSHSAYSWEQTTMVDFMSRFPDTFQTVTHRSLFDPNVLRGMNMLTRQILDGVAQALSSLTHSSIVRQTIMSAMFSAIAIRPGCRWNFGSTAASPAFAKTGNPSG